jgi:hypothetical protein
VRRGHQGVYPHRHSLRPFTLRSEITLPARGLAGARKPYTVFRPRIWYNLRPIPADGAARAGPPGSPNPTGILAQENYRG